MIENSLSLWQLSNDIQSLLPQLYDIETGEVNQEIDKKINELIPSTKNKCISVASYITRLQADKKQLEALQQEVKARQEAYDHEINRLHDYLQSSMERSKIKEISCPFFTIKLKLNPYSTDIENIDDIPIQFKREIIKKEIKADKNLIKEEVLKTGIQVPGAHVHQKTKLQISIDKI